MLYATVRQRKIHVKKPETVIRNGINVDWLILDMDDEWKEMDSIVAVFTNGSVSLEMLHTFGEPLLVPWECLKETGLLSVSCTGYVADEQIMTTKLPDSFWNVVQNGPVTGGTPMEPTATLYEQILAAAGSANSAADRANEISDQLLQDKENGVFDGEDGTGFQLSGLYATLGALQTAHPTGSAGEAYAVGTEAANTVYIWDLDRQAWVSIGPMQGVPGKDGRGIRTIAANDDGSWTITYTDSSTATVNNDSLVAAIEAASEAAHQAMASANYANAEGARAEEAADTVEDGLQTLHELEENVRSELAELERRADSGEFDGAPGMPGEPGVSPTASVSKADGVTTVSFTDVNGVQTAQIHDGAPGEKGAPGATGAGVQSMTYNSSTNQWTVLLTDGNSLTVDGPAIPDVSGYMPKSGGTFTGSVKAATASTTAYYVRNIKFSTSEETPTTEGDICFKLA